MCSSTFALIHTFCLQIELSDRKIYKTPVIFMCFFFGITASGGLLDKSLAQSIIEQARRREREPPQQTARDNAIYRQALAAVVCDHVTPGSAVGQYYVRMPTKHPAGGTYAHPYVTTHWSSANVVVLAEGAHDDLRPLLNMHNKVHFDDSSFPPKAHHTRVVPATQLTDSNDLSALAWNKSFALRAAAMVWGGATAKECATRLGAIVRRRRHQFPGGQKPWELATAARMPSSTDEQLGRWFATDIMTVRPTRSKGHARPPPSLELPIGLEDLKAKRVQFGKAMKAINMWRSPNRKQPLGTAPTAPPAKASTMNTRARVAGGTIGKAGRAKATKALKAEVAKCQFTRSGLLAELSELGLGLSGAVIDLTIRLAEARRAAVLDPATKALLTLKRPAVLRAAALVHVKTSMRESVRSIRARINTAVCESAAAGGPTSDNAAAEYDDQVYDAINALVEGRIGLDDQVFIEDVARRIPAASPEVILASVTRLKDARLVVVSELCDVDRDGDEGTTLIRLASTTVGPQVVPPLWVSKTPLGQIPRGAHRPTVVSLKRAAETCPDAVAELTSLMLPADDFEASAFVGHSSHRLSRAHLQSLKDGDMIYDEVISVVLTLMGNDVNSRHSTGRGVYVFPMNFLEVRCGHPLSHPLLPFVNMARDLLLNCNWLHGADDSYR
jgi:hypothetical protein